MGLITKEVEMKWHHMNKEWYENKGYVFTKFTDFFTVKVEDIQHASDIKVDVECDGCGKKLENMVWRTYKNSVKENGKCYCHKCAVRLYGGENLRKSLLANGKSFEQWCIENNRKDVLDRWDYELNSYKPSEICYGAKKKYYLKCPNGLHQSELKNIGGFVYGQSGSINCNACNSFAQWGIDNIGDDFLYRYWDFDKNNEIGNDPWKITKGNAKRVFIKCQEKDYHGSYKIKCNHFTNGVRCNYCGNYGVHPLDSLGALYPEVLDIWSGKNDKSPYGYNPNSHTKVWWKCLDGKHEDYHKTIIDANGCSFRCPDCVRERDESFLQEKVRMYLKKLGYITLHEHNCNIIAQNPKHKGSRGQMPYDNEVIELKLIIEVNGIQHYEESYGTWFAENFDLHKRQLYDRYKRIFVKYKGYSYLEIPYWEEKNDGYKILIDNKIKEILKTYKHNVIN